MLAQSAAANATPRARYLTPPLTPSTSATSTSATPPAPVTAIGYFAIVRAVRASARLTSTERLVLLTIAGHLDNATATAAVGIPRLAAETAFTTRTIERTVAALVAAGWLTRASAASRWGTNVYQVTPVAEDVRAAGPRRLHGRGTPDTGSGHPRHRIGAPPDTGSPVLLSILNVEPPVCSASATPPAGESTHTIFEVYQVPEKASEAPVVAPATSTAPVVVDVAPAPKKASEAPTSTAATLPDAEVVVDVAPAPKKASEAPPVVALLAAHPELRPIARASVAALLVAEGRPLPVVRRALAELAEATRDAAAVEDPWSAATLARKARAYVRRAYAEPSDTSTSTRPVSPEPPPEPPPQLHAVAANLRAAVAGIGGGWNPRPSSRAPSTRPNVGHLATATANLRGMLAALDVEHEAPVVRRRA